MTDLTEDEQAMLVYACEQHAANFYGGVFRFGADDAARYLGETVLEELIPRVGWRDLIGYARACLAEHPEYLTATVEQRAVWLAGRAQTAAEHDQYARDAYNAGDFPLAAAHIVAACQAAPVFRRDRVTVDWQRVLNHISAVHDRRVLEPETV